MGLAFEAEALTDAGTRAARTLRTAFTNGSHLRPRMGSERTSIRKEGAMRRGWGIVAVIVGVLLLVGVGIASYNAGVDAGITRGGGAGHVVEVVGPRYGYGWHGGFFPFGLLFFPLVILGVILLIRFAVGGPRWGHGWGYGPGHHGPWSEEGRARFEERFDEWHRRQHEQGSTSPDPGGGSTA
jgi:hypothetical protein